jgi:hypothetical protein
MRQDENLTDYDCSVTDLNSTKIKERGRSTRREDGGSGNCFANTGVTGVYEESL